MHTAAEATLWGIAAVAAIALTAGGRALIPALRGLRWRRATGIVALAAPLLVLWALPPSAYHFAGHEGAYGELLDGGRPWEDLDSYRILPVPSSVAAALGAVLPSAWARWLWLMGNRAALGAAILLAAAAASRLARRLGRDEGSAGLVAALGLAATTSVLGWSATAYALVPALALGLGALCLGLADRPGAALALGGLALGTRLEQQALVLAAALASGPALLDPKARRGLVGGVAAGLAVVAALALRAERLPVDLGGATLPEILENLRAVPLGGPWMRALPLAALLALVVLRRPPLRPLLPILLAALVAGMQVLPLPDLGARHLMVLSALLAVLGGALCAGRPGWALLLLAPVLLSGAVGLSELRRRYATGQDAALHSWVEQADRGPSGPIDQRMDPACYLVLPHGEEDWPGASPSGDVHEIHNARRELDTGGCVLWAVWNGAEFTGDTRGERFDRARLLLGLRPDGWIERGDGERWMLWRAP